jgi:hypothetical protein
MELECIIILFASKSFLLASSQYIQTCRDTVVIMITIRVLGLRGYLQLRSALQPCCGYMDRLGELSFSLLIKDCHTVQHTMPELSLKKDIIFIVHTTSGYLDNRGKCEKSGA